MILTLFYMYATILQWWRLGNLKRKLDGTLNTKNALLVCDEKVIFETKKQRSLENLLFRNENRIGCTVVPKQKINLTSQWVCFPKNYRYFPIRIMPFNQKLESPTICVLLQAVLDSYIQHDSETLELEKFGEPIAWRATDYFEVILKTDLDKLTKLVHCFSQHNCDINHDLQLLKLETIYVEGNPTKVKFERTFSLESTMKYSHLPVHWRNFVTDIKSLYAKVHDVTTPKITIENGKIDELKKVPVSEVKPIKKDSKKSEESKNTLDVGTSDYRRHKEKKDRDKSTEKYKKKLESHKEEKTREKTLKKTDTQKDLHSKKEEFPKCDEPDSSNVKDLKNPEPQHSKKPDVAPKELKKDDKHKKELKSTAEKPKEDHKSSKRTKDELNKEKEPKESKDKELHKKRKDSTEKKDKEPPVKPEKSGTKQKLDSKTTLRSNSKEKKLVKTPAICEPSALDGNIGKNDLTNGACVKHKTKITKPPNILVYGDSLVAKENVKSVIEAVVNKNRYVVYDLPTNTMAWTDTTALVVVCGTVPPDLTSSLLSYLLNGGQMLCLCSDLLYSVLHTFTTAEVREHELVRFSYKNWKSVKMMHHIFCYQASPAKKQFSKDSDTTSNHSGSGGGSSPVAPRTPSAVDVQHNNKNYTIQVQVLGAEETWQTPSLLLAQVKGTSGRAIFSQVHLEINPNQYEDDESKFKALKESNSARLEILKDILANHLEIDCAATKNVEFSPAYFLGRHDLKLGMLSECENIRDKKIDCSGLTLNFLGKDEKHEKPSITYLPVLIHCCPSNFSTVSYFETLNTEHVGRLVIYSDILTSSQTILKSNVFRHGLVLIPRQQVAGYGRSNNTWISPLGCAMFSMQIHLPIDSSLGKVLSFLQHLVSVAVVMAVKKLTCEDLEIGIKWPNDIYVYKSQKIGGLIVNTQTCGKTFISTVGVGVNLDNSDPTTCINDVVRSYNEKRKKKIPLIGYEVFFATVFNETERLIKLSEEQLEDVYDMYQKYWLHNNENVTVIDKKNKSQDVKIVGVNDYGFLKVRGEDGSIFTVQSDDNTFDMMNGLICPK